MQVIKSPVWIKPVLHSLNTFMTFGTQTCAEQGKFGGPTADLLTDTSNNPCSS